MFDMHGDIHIRGNELGFINAEKKKNKHSFLFQKKKVNMLACEKCTRMFCGCIKVTYGMAQLKVIPTVWSSHRRFTLVFIKVSVIPTI